MEITIERILPGGWGLAHAGGRTLMVALAAPGDRLRVQVDRVRGNVSFASIKEIITPAPDRVAPPCPYFGRCGGCDFQQLNYQAQLAAKVEIIKDCLRRIGCLEEIPDFQIVPAPEQWHYRSRAQWQYDAIRQRLGYFESGSRRVCDVAECAVLAPRLQQTLNSLREQMQDGLLPDHARDFRAVVGNDAVSLAPALQGKRVREITRSIHGEVYQLNAESFFQANDELLPQLIEAAIGKVSGKTALELYCGVGLFTIPLARRFTHVAGVEADSTAANFARVSLANAGLENAEVANNNAGDWLEENMVCGHLSPLAAKRPLVAALQSPLDFLLLDPPRTGAESRVIAGLLKLRPKHVCYVSCDPATLARDLKKLIAAGYALDSLAAFDMFPQTHHVETVAHLSG
jgi:23S rRNA (uracil1939-C5)-methyltransferase